MTTTPPQPSSDRPRSRPRRHAVRLLPLRSTARTWRRRTRCPRRSSDRRHGADDGVLPASDLGLPPPRRPRSAPTGGGRSWAGRLRRHRGSLRHPARVRTDSRRTPVRESLSAAVLAVGLVAMLLGARRPRHQHQRRAPGTRGGHPRPLRAGAPPPLRRGAAQRHRPLPRRTQAPGPGWCWWPSPPSRSCAPAARRRCLTSELPGYAEYKSRTPMLVPALGRS